MDEQKIKDIATQVYQNLGTRFGISQTPAHSHNGVDSQQLDPTALSNVQTLSAQTGSALSGITVSNIAVPVSVFPIPILSSPPTGTAPEGTLVLAVDVVTTKLYARVNNTWVAIFH